MSEEGYLLEMCSGRAAWTVIPDGIDSIDLAIVSVKVEADGWECTLRNRLCYTFSGKAEITLYPSGKLLVKCEDENIAADIAKMHITNWLAPD